MQNDASNSEIIIYEGNSGQPSIEGETVWLTQATLAGLFKTLRPNITMHIKNIFDEGELNEDSVCKDLLLYPDYVLLERERQRTPEEALSKSQATSGFRFYSLYDKETDHPLTAGGNVTS